MESTDDNSLTFWYEHRFAYPTLSQLARSISSISVITANVERQFSARVLHGYNFSYPYPTRTEIFYP
jgi:hypothetical protein